MLHDFNKFMGSERKRIFEEKILEWKSKNEILEMYESGISPIQIASLFDHEIGLTSISQATTTFVDSAGNKRVVRPFGQSLTIANFSNRLKSIVSYSDVHREIHLNQPQWKKIRFKHLDKREEDVRELASSQLKKWARETQRKRRESGVYSPKYSIDYWLERESSYEVAAEAMVSYKNSISPMRVDFWMKRGFDINESKKIISNQAHRGAKATLESLKGNCVSALEKRIFELIENSEVSRQVFIGPYCYDIGSRKSRKLIEINGTYWHADPRIYKDEDILFGSKKALEIWARDAEKISYVKDLGYQVHVVWELDFCKNPNQTIELINKFLKDSK